MKFQNFSSFASGFYDLLYFKNIQYNIQIETRQVFDIIIFFTRDLNGYLIVVELCVKNKFSFLRFEGNEID